MTNDWYTEEPLKNSSVDMIEWRCNLCSTTLHYKRSLDAVIQATLDGLKQSHYNRHMNSKKGEAHGRTRSRSDSDGDSSS